MLQLSNNETNSNPMEKESEKSTRPMTNTTIENCDIEFNHQMLLSESEHEHEVKTTLKSTPRHIFQKVVKTP